MATAGAMVKKLKKATTAPPSGTRDRATTLRQLEATRWAERRATNVGNSDRMCVIS